MSCPIATDGHIAAVNLESARRRAWSRFRQGMRLPGVAEMVVDCELLTGQFFGDVDSLARLEALASQFTSLDNSYRAVLVQAQVASATHRFGDARGYLDSAVMLGAPRDAIARQRLTINQACGDSLDSVLATRRRMAASGQIEDQIPLGAVLADLGRFGEADAVYCAALDSYDGVSPFPAAWACFQLGMLWGELVPEPDPHRAAAWYQRAITYLPGYVKARVHLAEIYTRQHRVTDAETLLLLALSSRDPEVPWRLADVLIAQGRLGEGNAYLDVAKTAFDALLKRHPLAFADHAAEFFAGSGSNPRRALELARANYANRPTRRAFEQAHDIAAIA